MERCLCFTPQSRLGFLWVNKEQWALKGELNALQNCNTAWQILISLKVLYFKASFKGVDFPCAIRVCLACLAQLTNAGCHPALLISLLLSFVLSDKQPVGWGLNFTPAPAVCVWMNENAAECECALLPGSCGETGSPWLLLPCSASADCSKCTWRNDYSSIIRLLT